jgi:hypothetical protein
MVSLRAARGSEEPHGDRAYEQKRKPGRQISNLHCEHFSLHLQVDEDFRVYLRCTARGIGATQKSRFRALQE